ESPAYLAPQEAARLAHNRRPRQRDRTAQAAAAESRRRYRAPMTIASKRLRRNWGGAQALRGHCTYAGGSIVSISDAIAASVGLTCDGHAPASWPSGPIRYL